ncbi:MAG: peptide MFS transporter [Melioribacteraceae bacterium]|nr:peptide MFS transporter [Melioribacteraceae bacterium]
MLKGHPKGIMVMFFTEMWERFGFYILMAVLTLYMDSEFGWSDSVKGDHYGGFLGLVYFIPLLGGWLGDKILGQITTVKIGALLMSLGYIALALSSADQLVSFYIGLFLIAFGTGLFKVNMAVLIGNLYRNKVHLKDAGFNIFYMGVNVGATIAPLAATALGYLFDDYRMSFWAAAVGMFVCLITFQSGKYKLVSADVKQSDQKNEVLDEALITPQESVQRITTLIVLFLIVIFFWLAFYQNGFALTLFAERSTEIYNILRPETYQFFNPFFILVLTPLLLRYFSMLNTKGKEPSTPVKIFIGMLIMGASMVVMVFASLEGGNDDANNMSPAWLISTYFIVTLSEILISPMGQSYVSKVAPPKIQGLMMGGWFLATSAGSYLSGLLGKFYSDFQHHEYFMLLTGILIISAVLALLSMKRLKRFAH